jgi:hypothetical protein
VFPPGGGLASSGEEADVPGYVDRMLDVSQPRVRLLVRALLFLVEHATAVFPAPGRGGRRRFTALDAAQRVAALEGWAQSALYPRRVVFTSLRALLTLGYFAHPPLLRELEVAPWAIDTPVCEADLLFPRIGQRPESIRLGRADLWSSDGTPLDLDDPLHPDYAAPGAAAR